MALLKTTASLYPHSKIDEGGIFMMLSDLRDIPTDELRITLEQARRQCKFMPTVAELYEIYRSLTSRTGALAMPTWEEAWGEVKDAMSRYGRYGAVDPDNPTIRRLGTPSFSHPMIDLIVKRMGWEDLCANDKPSVDRGQFRKMWESFIEKNDKLDGLTPEAQRLADSHGVALRAILPDLSMNRNRKRIEAHNDA